MTQITKTLSIAGIIALATVPAMAEIASTQYVQNALNGLSFPTYSAGYGITIDNKNKIAVSYDNIYSMMNSWEGIAIGLDSSVDENSSENIAIGMMATANGGTDYDYEGHFPSIAIGSEATATGGYAIAIGYGATTSIDDVNFDMIAIGRYALAEYDDAIAIGNNAEAGSAGIAIGGDSFATGEAVAIGNGAKVVYTADGDGGIQLGYGTNSDSSRLKVYNTTLLDNQGKIPAVSLDSILPTPPSDCTNQKCALVRDATTNPVTYKWEVVRSTSSGQ